MSKRSGRNANRPTNARRRERERVRIGRKLAAGGALNGREARLYGKKAPGTREAA